MLCIALLYFQLPWNGPRVFLIQFSCLEHVDYKKNVETRQNITPLKNRESFASFQTSWKPGEIFPSFVYGINNSGNKAISSSWFYRIVAFILCLYLSLHKSVRCQIQYFTHILSLYFARAKIHLINVSEVMSYSYFNCWNRINCSILS